jgi:hypothetical protein
MVEYLLCKCKALSSNPVPPKTKSREGKDLVFSLAPLRPAIGYISQEGTAAAVRS